MYRKINFRVTDPNKKNILITVTQLEVRKYTYGYVIPLIDILKEKFNVYILLESHSKTPDNFNLTNVYLFDKKFYKRLKEGMHRREQDPNSEKYNNNIVRNSLVKFFKKEPKFHDIIVVDNHNLMLPNKIYTRHPAFQNYINDFFDIFTDDEEIKKEVKDLNEKWFKNIGKAFSPLTFSYCYKNIFLNACHILYKMHQCKIDIIIMDPSGAIPFFKLYNINYKFWYFTDDFRGSRELHRFPLSELQHLVYEKNYNPIIRKNLLTGNKKILNHFFAGDLLVAKGTRKYIWKQFFKDFKYDKTEFYFGVNKFLGLTDKEYEKIKNEVDNHPLFFGGLMDNIVYTNKLKSAKTAFIARNVSAEEGLTYRHIQYLDLDVLPIFDCEYDSTYIWIPKEFQDKLTVSNHKELMKVVDYYVTHEDERIELLNKMKEYYKIDEWPKNWKQMIKETNFYKELC